MGKAIYKFMGPILEADKGIKSWHSFVSNGILLSMTSLSCPSSKELRTERMILPILQQSCKVGQFNAIN